MPNLLSTLEEWIEERRASKRGMQAFHKNVEDSIRNIKNPTTRNLERINYFLMHKHRTKTVLISLAIVALGITSFAGGFGTRREITEYSFSYERKPVEIRREDIRLGPDRWYFFSEGNKIPLRQKFGYKTQIKTDDGKIIQLYESIPYSTEEQTK